MFFNIYQSFGIFPFLVIVLIIILAFVYHELSNKKERLLYFEKSLQEKTNNYNELKKQFDSIKKSNVDLVDLNNKQHVLISKRESELEKIFEENIKYFPYLAGIIADYKTYDIELLAKQLDWGSDVKRLSKVKSIREIKKDAETQIAIAKESEYQLKYLLQLFPNLEEFINIDYKDLPETLYLQDKDISIEDYSTKKYLTSDEWFAMPDAEKNQLALDRYINSTRKNKWQIGRDYELYIGYLYESVGWNINYFGSTKKLEDLGRDLIAKKDSKTEIIQCKYWSNKKQIHEKHIFQLYGTTICYMIENNVYNNITARIVTNIELSETAKIVADYLGIKYTENKKLGDYPRIKCNINRNEYGEKTYIYHLPMDQQYDSVIIDKSKGEFFAKTVLEAEEKGFRHAYKWHG